MIIIVEEKQLAIERFMIHDPTAKVYNANTVAILSPIRTAKNGVDWKTAAIVSNTKSSRKSCPDDKNRDSIKYRTYM